MDIPKKKRGRKPKIKIPVDPNIPVVKKKRGRKKKVEIVDPTVSVDGERKRKRGRKPKCEIASIHEIRERFNNQEDKVVFSGSNECVETDLEQIQVPFGNLNITVHSAKPVDKKELRQMFNKSSIPPPTSHKNIPSPTPTIKIFQPQQNNSGPEKFLQPHGVSDFSESEPDIPIKKNKPKSNVLIKEVKNIHRLLHKFTTKMGGTQSTQINEWPQKCSSLCWWCCHTFLNVPIPCVSNYDYKRKRYHLNGVFCSWECASAFTRIKFKSLIDLYRLKKEWTGDASILDIAPSRYILKAFGGYMSIEDFRKSPHKDRKIIISDTKFSYENLEIAEIHKEIVNKKKKKYTIRKS